MKSAMCFDGFAIKNEIMIGHIICIYTRQNGFCSLDYYSRKLITAIGKRFLLEKMRGRIINDAKDSPETSLGNFRFLRKSVFLTELYRTFYTHLIRQFNRPNFRIFVILQNSPQIQPLYARFYTS